jgi:hypothetical protein
MIPLFLLKNLVLFIELEELLKVSDLESPFPARVPYSNLIALWESFSRSLNDNPLPANV